MGGARVPAGLGCAGVPAGLGGAGVPAGLGCAGVPAGLGCAGVPGCLGWCRCAWLAWVVQMFLLAWQVLSPLHPIHSYLLALFSIYPSKASFSENKQMSPGHVHSVLCLTFTGMCHGAPSSGYGGHPCSTQLHSTLWQRNNFALHC